MKLNGVCILYLYEIASHAFSKYCLSSKLLLIWGIASQEKKNEALHPLCIACCLSRFCDLVRDQHEFGCYIIDYAVFCHLLYWYSARHPLPPPRIFPLHYWNFEQIFELFFVPCNIWAMQNSLPSYFVIWDGCLRYFSPISSKRNKFNSATFIYSFLWSYALLQILRF